MVKKIGQEFHCLKGKGRNSKVCKNKVGSPMVKKIGQEFQCLKEKGRKSNV